jgi:purine-nucleoside phosphorylase
MEIVIGTGASTDSGMNNARFPFAHFAPIANSIMVREAEDVAKRLGIKVYTGGVLASDFFYPYMDPKTLKFYWNGWKVFAIYGVLAVEMESAELFTLCALHKVQALTLLTISDTLARKSKPLTSEQRASSFGKMVKIALRTITGQ